MSNIHETLWGHISLEWCPVYVLQAFTMLEVLIHVKNIPSGSAKTCLWAQNDAERSMCQLKLVASHFSVGSVLLSSRWKPSWVTDPQVICSLEHKAGENLACVVFYWQDVHRKRINVAQSSINGNLPSSLWLQIPCSLEPCQGMHIRNVIVSDVGADVILRYHLSEPSSRTVWSCSNRSYSARFGAISPSTSCGPGHKRGR